MTRVYVKFIDFLAELLSLLASLVQAAANFLWHHLNSTFPEENLDKNWQGSLQQSKQSFAIDRWEHESRFTTPDTLTTPDIPVSDGVSEIPEHWRKLQMKNPPEHWLRYVSEKNPQLVKQWFPEQRDLQTFSEKRIELAKAELKTVPASEDLPNNLIELEQNDPKGVSPASMGISQAEPGHPKEESEYSLGRLSLAMRSRAETIATLPRIRYSKKSPWSLPVAPVSSAIESTSQSPSMKFRQAKKNLSPSKNLHPPTLDNHIFRAGSGKQRNTLLGISVGEQSEYSEIHEQLKSTRASTPQVDFKADYVSPSTNKIVTRSVHEAESASHLPGNLQTGAAWPTLLMATEHHEADAETTRSLEQILSLNFSKLDAEQEGKVWSE